MHYVRFGDLLVCNIRQNVVNMHTCGELLNLRRRLLRNERRKLLKKVLSRNSSFDSTVASYEDIRGSNHAISLVSKTGFAHQGICETVSALGVS